MTPRPLSPWVIWLAGLLALAVIVAGLTVPLWGPA